MIAAEVAGAWLDLLVEKVVVELRAAGLDAAADSIDGDVDYSNAPAHVVVLRDKVESWRGYLSAELQAELWPKVEDVGEPNEPALTAAERHFNGLVSETTEALEKAGFKAVADALRHAGLDPCVNYRLDEASHKAHPMPGPTQETR